MHSGCIYYCMPSICFEFYKKNYHNDSNKNKTAKNGNNIMTFLLEKMLFKR